jgi:tRNA (guanine-N7-)-methyltransferase
MSIFVKIGKFTLQGGKLPRFNYSKKPLPADYREKFNKNQWIDMSARKLKEFEKIALEFENIEGILNFPDVFGRKKAVHIEVGSGKGTFLVSQALSLPDVDFLGIEWARKYYRYAVDRIGRRKLGNVRLIRTDAALFIEKNIASESVDCFHIYFPDPWPKRSHHKRRFICGQNINQIVRCLKQGGIINIATDHKDYFEWMKKEFAPFGDELKIIDFVKPAGAKENELVGTNFERKYIKEKRNINTIAFKKI